MSTMRCPRCGLSLRLRFDDIRCPRCIAKSGMLVQMEFNDPLVMADRHAHRYPVDRLPRTWRPAGEPRSPA